MLVNDPSVIVGSSGLLSVEIVDGNKVKIKLKNGNTLTFEPQVMEDLSVVYKMDYLTGKENKQIEKIKNKIEELQKQMAEVQTMPIEIKNNEEDDEEDNLDTEEDEDNNKEE